MSLSSEVNALATRIASEFKVLRGFVEAIVSHDGTAGGGTRPVGYKRVRWVGGTTRPENMITGDVWEHIQ